MDASICLADANIADVLMIVSSAPLFSRFLRLISRKSSGSILPPRSG
jgi:hypothetical protein